MAAETCSGKQTLLQIALIISKEHNQTNAVLKVVLNYKNIRNKIHISAILCSFKGKEDEMLCLTLQLNLADTSSCREPFQNTFQSLPGVYYSQPGYHQRFHSFL